MKKVFSLLLVLMLVLSIAVPGMAAGKTKTKITLDRKGTVTLNLGETLQLHATVTPEAAVTWKSSKKSVATVENGLVTPHKEGKATITAKAGGKTAKVTVKVVDPTKPTKLALHEGKKVTLDIDKTLKLTPVFTPSTASSELAYKSSKKSVATVENGVVLPHKEGTAKITVTCAKNKKAKATITVKVVDPYKPTKLVIDQGKSVTLTAGSTLALTATLAPATAKAELTFKSSKKSVASVDASGIVTTHKKGTAKITITAKNNKKAKATITIKVNKAGKVSDSKDLLNYFGKPLTDVINNLGFTNKEPRDDEKGPRIRVSAKGALVEGSGSVPENSYIDYIHIFDESDFNIAGISNGMKWIDAQAKLKSSGWEFIYDDEDHSTYQKENLVLAVKQAGKVSEVWVVQLW